MDINKPNNLDTSIIFIDEFKGNVDNQKYQLAMYDKNHNLIYILKNIYSSTIKEKIESFEVKPKIIVTDMFKPFISLINSLPYDIQIVADKYHVVRQANGMLRDYRQSYLIKIMKNIDY